MLARLTICQDANVSPTSPPIEQLSSIMTIEGLTFGTLIGHGIAYRPLSDSLASHVWLEQGPGKGDLYRLML